MIIFSTSSILSDALSRACDDKTTHCNTTRSTVGLHAKYFRNKLVTRTYYSETKTRLVNFSFTQYFHRKPERSERDRDQNRAPMRGKEREIANRDRAIKVALQSGDVTCDEKTQVKKMKNRRPHELKANGGAGTEENAGLSIIRAFVIDNNLCHKEVCKALLPYVAGWERVLIGELAIIDNIGAIRTTKLIAIAEQVVKSPPRLCRYCQGKAQAIDEYSYYCNKCGNCLNLNWGGDQ